MADQPRAPSAAGNRNTATVYPHDSRAPRPVRISQRVRFLRGFLAILGCSTCFVGFVALIYWLITITVTAAIAYPHIHVEALTVSNFSASSDWKISGAWDAQFIVLNPNLLTSIHCDRIQGALIYNSCSISDTTVPSFVQGAMKKTAIRARFDYTHLHIYEFNKVSAKSHGAIKVSLKMMVRFRASFRVAEWLRVSCRDLTILVSSRNNSGTLIGGRKKCIVENEDELGDDILTWCSYY